MRLERERLELVDAPELQRIQQELFGSAPEVGAALNVTRLWALHPALMKAQRPMQQHVMSETTLSPRHRELAILRIGWRCRSGYELAQHARFGREAGLSSSDLQRITVGPDAPGWEPIESALLRAVDEMFDDCFVSEETWQSLESQYSTEQLLDLLVLVGRYWTVSVVLNSTGVQLEPDTLDFESQLRVQNQETT
jgi:4-carboxymuconolactone decarboxylase